MISSSCGWTKMENRKKRLEWNPVVAAPSRLEQFFHRISIYHFESTKLSLKKKFGKTSRNETLIYDTELATENTVDKGSKRDLRSLKYYHLQTINKDATTPALRINRHYWASGKRLLTMFQMKPFGTLKAVHRAESKETCENIYCINRMVLTSNDFAIIYNLVAEYHKETLKYHRDWH